MSRRPELRVFLAGCIFLSFTWQFITGSGSDMQAVVGRFLSFLITINDILLFGFDDSVLLNNVDVGTIVITSYSIHYTKLYENRDIPGSIINRSGDFCLPLPGPTG